MSKRLAKQEEDVLTALSGWEEYCHNYSSLGSATGIKREYLEPIIKHLKELDYIVFWRGLMTELHSRYCPNA